MGNVAMAGTSPNFEFRLRINLEEGYGQYDYCIICDGAKQTTRVTYPGIKIEQVRNCATSLVIKKSGDGYNYASGFNNLNPNQTWIYDKYNAPTITSFNDGYLDVYTNI